MVLNADLAEIQANLSFSRLVAIADDVADRIAAPLAQTVDQEAHWPIEALRALGEEGLLGLNVPRRLGGLGHGLSALAQVTEALGKTCSSTAMCFGMHCVATAVIAAKAMKDIGEDDQAIRNWLARLVRAGEITNSTKRAHILSCRCS